MTVVRRSPDYDESGRTLRAAAMGATEVVDPALGRTLELVVGPGFGGVAALGADRFSDAGPAESTAGTTAGPSAPPLEARSAAVDICA